MLNFLFPVIDMHKKNMSFMMADGYSKTIS